MLRDAFWDAVYDIACKNKDIVLVSADFGAPSLDKFRMELATQYIDVGIAEQNAVSLSAGLALSGKKVSLILLRKKMSGFLYGPEAFLSLCQNP